MPLSDAMRRSVAVVAGVTLLLCLPSLAAADTLWKQSRTDAMELGVCPGEPCYGFDMQSATVRIRLSDHGRRYFTITLRSFWVEHSLQSGFALDTKGGARADFRGYLDSAKGMSMGSYPASCGVRVARPDSRVRPGKYRTLDHGSVVTCRLPLSWIARTKPIRWRVWTNDIFPQPYSMLDRVPDHGWTG